MDTSLELPKIKDLQSIIDEREAENFNMVIEMLREAMTDYDSIQTYSKGGYKIVVKDVPRITANTSKRLRKVLRDNGYEVYFINLYRTCPLPNWVLFFTLAIPTFFTKVGNYK